MHNKDTLWKGAIEDFFPEMMEFLYPDCYGEFDYSAIEFLDKELRELVPTEENQGRRADMLVKLRKKSGQEIWLVLHIEIQGYHEPNFEERMFQYFYRIYDRYRVPVEGLAIYTDPNKNFRPDVHVINAIESENTYRFKTYKVLEQDRQYLEESSNPFAVVVLTTLEALETGKVSDEDLFKQKTQLFRNLFTKGFDKKSVKKLAFFIRDYARFSSQKTDKLYRKRLNLLLEKKETMGLLELAKQQLLEDTKQDGIEQGIQKGMEQGIQKGMEQGVQKGVEQGIQKGMELLISNALLNGLEKEQVIKFLDAPEDIVTRVYHKLVRQGKIKEK